MKKSRAAVAQEVLLGVEWVGLCGSDVHQWADGGVGERRIVGPFVLGHEASATVLDANGSTQLAVGSWVVVSGFVLSFGWLNSTGQCFLVPALFLDSLRWG